MNLELKDHVAVVTGGASGIGWASAHNFVREGCRVALWDRSPQVVERAKELGNGAIGIDIDVSDNQAVQAAIAETEKSLGAVQHLVHAAAIGSGKFGFPFTNLEPEDWRRVLDVNVMGMVHVAHAITPGMKSRHEGTMIFLASIAGQIGSQTDPPYSASKAATLNFAQCLAKDLATHNVRVNCVNPGMVKTPLNQRVWQAWNQQQSPGHQRSYEDWAGDKVRAVVPLGRWQEPEDVADLIVFVSSARAAQITGQAMNVDGGQVMHW